MSLGRRITLVVAALFAASALLTLIMVALLDSGSGAQMRALSIRLDQADRDRLQAMVAEQAGQVLGPLAVLADGKRGELMAGVQVAVDSAPLRAVADPLAASAQAPKIQAKKGTKLAGPDPKAALQSVAGPMKELWESALLTDVSGKVIASWPKETELGRDLSKDPVFKAVSDPSMSPGLPLTSYHKHSAQVSVPVPKDKAKDVKTPSAKAMVKTVASVDVACGLEGPAGSFGGMLLVSADLGLAMLGGGAELAKALPGGQGATMLLRGNGDELFHSKKEAFSENLASISPDYKALLLSMQKSPQGKAFVPSYDGAAGVLVWQRVGNWTEGSAVEALLNLVVFVPESALKQGASAALETPKAFYARVLFWLLFIVAFGVPVAVASLLLKKVGQPFERSAELVRDLDEFAPLPPEIMFRHEQDLSAQTINRALDMLIRRVASSEGRVSELDSALRRVEEQASQDATAASMELSELRKQMTASGGDKAAFEARVLVVQAAKTEMEGQVSNLKSALDTAQKNTDLKAAENRNLLVQVQDLMRSVEEQRKVAEKVQENMVKRDGELVRLAAVNTLSAELKATLTVIKNYISTMLGTQGAISDAQQEFLGVVINKSARLERLIGDLLELSEIGSGIKPLKLESLAPAQLVQEALLNARPQAEAKKIALEFAESAMLSAVSADREKMGSVLRSLLAQAVKVTSRGEKIGILLSERETSVELRITDPGMSLPPDRAAKVFAQFHGVDSQAGPEFIGTGLRFPILRSVLEAHGGKIWIESQVGRGKTFVVSLPKAGTSALPQGFSMAPALTAPAMVAPAAPLMSGSLAGLPPIAPMPPSLPKMPPAIPSLPTPALFRPAPAEAPVIHKPAPVDDSFNAPWKAGKKKDDELDADLPSLDALGMKPLTSSPLQLGAPILKTDAKPSGDDVANFDKIFGGMPPQAEEQKGGVPKVELKTAAKPNEDEMAKFAALFGGAVPTPPPGMGAPPPPSPSAKPAASPADFSNFASVFGGTPPPGLGAPPPPPPTAKPASPPADFANFASVFGGTPPPGMGAPPPPPPGLATPAPPPKPALPSGDMAKFDALFGPSTGSVVPAPPAPPAPGPKPAGLNDMDDLSKMLGS